MSAAARPLPPLLLRGDCLQRLRDLPDESVDAVVTDPPYGLEFMGKAWDNFGAGFNGGGTSATKNAPSFGGEGANASCASCGGRMRGANPCRCAVPDFRVKGEPVTRGSSTRAAMHAFEAFTYSWAAEALRVLKPGGHLLAFGGSRTWHRLAAGIEDAGFEVRDSIAWLYGSGFPKSLDVSKAIDKAAGAEREKVRKTGAASAYSANAGNDRPWTQRAREEGGIDVDGDTPRTPEAAAWQGWGTALKPAFEPIVVARKPLVGTVAANVLQYGTGALNIDANRVGSGEDSQGYRSDSEPSSHRRYTERGAVNIAAMPGPRGGSPAGRWPANVVLDESQASELDKQAPKAGAAAPASGPTRTGGSKSSSMAGALNGTDEPAKFYADLGGASRFFYVAKAPKSERPVTVDPETGARVAHPTVKPLALMRWLVRLVTPPGGVVLDPFAGSGTTLEAAHLEGFEAIGVELTPDYWPLIESRIERAVATRAKGGK